MLSIVPLLVVLLVAGSAFRASGAAPKTPVREIPRNSGLLLPLAWSAAGASGALPLPAGANRTTSLDGYWNFVTDPSGNLKVGDLASASNIRKALVPGSWQSQFDDLRDYAGVAWYWTSLTVDDVGPDQIVLVHFGAADYRAEVYVNAQIVGSHEGGYLPFEFDVTSRLHPGENQLAVRIADPGAKPDQVEGIKYAEIAHGKQNWYVQTSGPWQSVEIEVRPRMHLGPTRITARADGTFQIEVPIENLSLGSDTSGHSAVRAQILEPGGKVAWEGALDLKAGQAKYAFSGRLSKPSLWSPASPALYTLRVGLSSGDTQDYRFGFRTFETRGGKFYLNGNVVYLRGALDQAFYPDTSYTEPSLDDLRAEMRRAKELGLNLLRCHIKVPDPRYLQAADETGILIWYEIPNWDKLTEDSKRRGLETLRGMVGRDWNHPAIVIVSVINESWGASLKEAPDRQWLKQMYGEAKAIVPGWLVDDNSACCDNFHLATDLADFHQYNAIPDYAGDFDRFVTDLATRPRWLFSPYGDSTPRGDEPLVLSEFGNWGLPRLPRETPWWFGRSFEGREITLPEGIERRFADYQHDSLFHDPNALIEATDKHQYEALKYEIESLRMHPEMQGYVITEFTDVNWEANGMLDMWRQPKSDPELFRKLQQDDLIVARAEKRNYTPGEKARASVYVSHFSDEALGRATVEWQLDDGAVKGSLALPAVATGSGVKAGELEFTVPSVSSPSESTLKVALVAAGGKIFSETSVELFFFPARRPELPPPVAFEDPAGKLRRLVNAMRSRGYQPPAGAEAYPIMIASVFDDKAKQTLEAGGRVILLANDRQALAPGIEVVPRAGSNLDGNWISGFLWLRRDQEPFKQFAFGKMAGFETQAVTPSAVVRGVPPQSFKDVLAGMFYGWIHSNVGTLVQARYGKGKLLICTFSLGTTYGSDPYATYLLDALVSYAASDFSPQFEIPIRGK